MRCFSESFQNQAALARVFSARSRQCAGSLRKLFIAAPPFGINPNEQVFISATARLNLVNNH
jgi:hypothetical protein